LAESLARAGQSERAMEVVVEALGVVEASGERFYAAELHRLKGELLRELGHAPGEVSTCFSLAVDLARSQQARVLEHRARASLEKSTS
jgi:predicted ATPase